MLYSGTLGKAQFYRHLDSHFRAHDNRSIKKCKSRYSDSNVIKVVGERVRIEVFSA